MPAGGASLAPSIGSEMSAANPPPTRQVVTRIAPSPTGMMHIGTARTALFNWLYARHLGGEFLLRIEDTDRERSTEGAVQAIFDGLCWLGLDADAPPVFQHTRAERHREAVEALYEAGHAYRCYMTVQELAVEREKARAEGRAIRSPWRDRDPPVGDNRTYVIRFRGPLDGETVVHDLIKGPIVFANKELDDLVLLRSDGAPTYNLAVVVDDHDMAISHIIRGDDHLSNAARQSLIYQALGFELPAFAHVPMIHGPDGAKLSKRHGAQGVSEFADLGYLPEAMRNYLARLGWGHGDDEIFSDDQAIAWFDVADVVRAPARLDWSKLNHINNHYIRAADDHRLADLVAGKALEAEGVAARRRPGAPAGGDPDGQGRRQDHPRARRPQPVRPQGTAAHPGRQGRRPADRGDPRAPGSASPRPWRRTRLDKPAALRGALRAFAAAEGDGMGAFGQALRAVLAGGASAPDLASALTALGKSESLGRIEDALSQVR